MQQQKPARMNTQRQSTLKNRSAFKLTLATHALKQNASIEQTVASYAPVGYNGKSPKIWDGVVLHNIA